MSKIINIRLATFFCAITLTFFAQASLITEHQELFHACKNGRITILKYLLWVGANVNAVNEQGETPLSVAVLHEQLEVVSYLIKAGADLTHPRIDTARIIDIALERNHCGILQLLIDAGLDVNAYRRGEMPLYWAALEHDHLLDSAELLLKAGADVNFQDKSEETLLYKASRDSHLGIVNLLLAYKANVDIPNHQGRTPLWTASAHGDTDILETLINAGARVEIVDQDGTTPICIALSNAHLHCVKLLLKAGARINSSSMNTSQIDKEQLFRIALAENRCDVLQLLIQSGIDVNIQNKKDGTPLWITLRSGHFEAADILINAGANVDAQSKDTEKSLLYNASKLGRLDIVQWLIRNGAALESTDWNGGTPLWAASFEGHLDIVHALLDAGAKVGTARNRGDTPLYAACQNNHLAVAQTLIAAGANVNQAEADSGAPLHVASFKGHYRIAQLLIRAGADVNQKHNSGDRGTPLYNASWAGHTAIVKLLIEAGADLHQRTAVEVTCLQAAAKRGHLDIVRYLHYVGAEIDSVQSPQSAFRLVIENKSVMIARYLICKGAKVIRQDLEHVEDDICFLYILAGVADFLRAHPEELPKYQTAMQAYIDTLRVCKRCYACKLAAALCELLFSGRITIRRGAKEFSALGMRELHRIKWLRESFIKEKQLTPEIADLIFTDFLSLPRV